MHHEEEMVLGQQTAEEMRGMKSQVLLRRETFGHQSHNRSLSSQGIWTTNKPQPMTPSKIPLKKGCHR